MKMLSEKRAINQIFRRRDRAGLRADPRYQYKFPPSALATVSININFFSTEGRENG